MGGGGSCPHWQPGISREILGLTSRLPQHSATIGIGRGIDIGIGVGISINISKSLIRPFGVI